MSHSLSIGSYNVRGAMYNSLYIDILLKRYNIDLLAIQEHKLHSHNKSFLDLINSDYLSITTCNQSLDPYSWNCYGKGGVSILVKKSLLMNITPMNFENCDDRICGVIFKPDNSTCIYLINVYMPCAKESRAMYLSWLEKIQNIYHEYEEMGTVIIVGDLNAEIAGPKCPHPKSSNTPFLSKMIKQHNLTSINVQIDCNGPSYTYDPYESGNNRSHIDHILVDSIGIDHVLSCEVIDRDKDLGRCINHSDHLPIIAKFRLVE